MQLQQQTMTTVAAVAARQSVVAAVAVEGVLLR